MDRLPSEIRRSMQTYGGIAAIGYLIFMFGVMGLRSLPKRHIPMPDICTENGEQVPCPSYLPGESGRRTRATNSDDGSGPYYGAIFIGFCIIIPACVMASGARRELRNLEFELLDEAYQDRFSGRPSAPLPIVGMCAYCGAPYLPDQDFCTKCGRPLRDD